MTNLKLVVETQFLPTCPSWSSWSVSRNVSVNVCICLEIPLPHAIMCLASHWPSDHMITSRPLIALHCIALVTPPQPLPPPRFFLTLQAYIIGIGVSICSGQVSWCLSYAEFFLCGELLPNMPNMQNLKALLLFLKEPLILLPLPLRNMFQQPRSQHGYSPHTFHLYNIVTCLTWRCRRTCSQNRRV